MAKGLIAQGNARLTKESEADPADTRTPEEIAAAEKAAAALPKPRDGEGQAEPMKVPDPDSYDPGDVDMDAPLSEEDERVFTACETALDVLRIAFWEAGKALEVMVKGRLYRRTHRTMEEYVVDRWNMETSQAYRLMQAWRLAEIVSPIGDNKVNESQVRELLPVAARYDDRAAAVTLYSTLVSEAGDRRITAALIREAAKALPEDSTYNEQQFVQAVREFLTQPETDDASTWDTRVSKYRTAVTKMEGKSFIKAARTNREQALADLTAMSDALKRVIEAVEAE